MKILSINVYNYNRGGSETVYFNTSRLLEEHGHKVSYFTLKWDENLPSPYSAYFPESKETRRGMLRPLSNIVNYFYHFEAARNLERLIADERPDIAQVHLIWGQLTPSILRVLKRAGIPVVLTAHDHRIICPASVLRNGRGEACMQCEGSKFYKCVSNTCCKGSKGLSAMMAAEQYFRNIFFNPSRNISSIIYVSRFSEDVHTRYMPRLGELPSTVLYNFSKTFAQEPKSHAPARDDRRFMYFGRLIAEKGVMTLIKAFEKLPDLRLQIVGSGTDEEVFKKYVADRRLSNIEFLGFKQGKELERLTRDAYFVVLPSECYENNPLTIVESYSMATPVIGAEIGGIPEIVEDGITGYRFTPGNVESLVDALTKAAALSDDEYAAMSGHAFEFARNNFDREVYYRKLISFFNETISRKG